MSPRMGGYVPSDHKTRHQDGGRDEISIADLAGESVNLAAHKLVLDAHHLNQWLTLCTGQYIMTAPGATYAYALAANRLYSCFLPIPRDMTFDTIAIYVSTADASGDSKTARLGIYNNGTNLYPGTLVKDYGTVAVGTTGLKAITFTQQLTKGLYWLVVVSDGTATIRGWQNNMGILGFSTGVLAAQDFWFVAHTYAALPATFPAGGTAALSPPTPFLRLLSLD